MQFFVIFVSSLVGVVNAQDCSPLRCLAAFCGPVTEETCDGIIKHADGNCVCCDSCVQALGKHSQSHVTVHLLW